MYASEKDELQSKHSVLKDVTTIKPIDNNLPNNSAPNPIQNTTQPNTRITMDLDNQMHVSQIYNNKCTQNETPSPNQSTVKELLIIKLKIYKKNGDTINTNIEQKTKNTPTDSMATTPVRQKL